VTSIGCQTLLQQLRNSARATHCRQIIPLAQWKPTLFSGGRSSTLSVAAAVSMATGQRQTETGFFADRNYKTKYRLGYDIVEPCSHRMN